MIPSVWPKGPWRWSITLTRQMIPKAGWPHHKKKSKHGLRVWVSGSLERPLDLVF
jgi:hypothetical protein